jgi:uncharacterized ferredoxin-like protein
LFGSSHYLVGEFEMPIMTGNDIEREAVLQGTKLLLIAARTAPKSGGVDDILTALVYGNEKEQVAAEMEKIAAERAESWIHRDGGSVRKSEVVVLIGVQGTKAFELNCGACGYSDCLVFEQAEKTAGNDFVGPTCIFKALDLGIALGSAVKMASSLNLDNRMMYTIGTAAKRLNLMPNASIIIGIPITATGKNIFFDRS